MSKSTRGCWAFALVVAVAGCEDPASPTVTGAARVLVSFDSRVEAQPTIWTYLPDMGGPREHFGAFIRGSCAWVVGGVGFSTWPITPTRAVESICSTKPRPTSWKLEAPLPEARIDFAGVGTIGQTSYVAGGFDSAGTMRATLYTYKPTTGWRLDAEPLPYAMSCGAGAVLGGKLYVFAVAVPPVDSTPSGPFDCFYEENVFAVYDPTRPVMQRWALLPMPPSGEGRARPGLAAYGNRLYLIGGTQVYDQLGVGVVEVFDPSSGQWLPNGTIPDFPLGQRGTTAVALSGRIFVFGGNWGDYAFSPANMTSVYDSVTNTWDDYRPTLATETSGALQEPRTSWWRWAAARRPSSSALRAVRMRATCTNPTIA